MDPRKSLIPALLIVAVAGASLAPPPAYGQTGEATQGQSSEVRPLPATLAAAATVVIALATRRALAAGKAGPIVRGVLSGMDSRRKKVALAGTAGVIGGSWIYDASVWRARLREEARAEAEARAQAQAPAAETAAPTAARPRPAGKVVYTEILPLRATAKAN